MKAIQDGAAFFFLAVVAILTVISILGVWEVYSTDVISKAFQTLALLGGVTIVIVIASRYMESRNDSMHAGEHLDVPNPLFKAIRNVTVGSLIVSLALLTLLGVLAIWDVVSDRDVLFKALGTMGLVAFASAINIMVCLDREKNKILGQHGSTLSGGSVVLLLIIFWILATVMM